MEREREKMKSSANALSKVLGMDKHELIAVLDSNEVPYEEKSFYGDNDQLINYKVYEVLTVVRLAYAMEARDKPKPVSKEELDKVDEEHPFNS